MGTPLFVGRPAVGNGPVTLVTKASVRRPVAVDRPGPSRRTGRSRSNQTRHRPTGSGSNPVRADGGDCTRVQLVELQAYSTEFFENSGRDGRGDGRRVGGEGRDLGREPVAVQDQDQEEAAEDHGPEGDAEEGDVDVGLGGLDVDAALGGGGAAPRGRRR